MKLSCRTRSATGGAILGLLLGVALTAGWGRNAAGCNTPVYRYAMYNWATAPYHVFYFHQGPIAAEDAAANRLLEEFAQKGPALANVVLQVVDTLQQKQLDELPGVVEETRKAKSDGNKPLHLIFTPWPAEPVAGRLDEAQVRQLVESPMRLQLGKLLDEGNAAVLLILAGPDEEANRRAVAAAEEAAAEAAAGKISVAGNDIVYPGDFGPKPPNEQPQPQAAEPSGESSGEPSNEASDVGPVGDGTPPAAASTLKVAVVRLTRDDPAERWLVRMLLAVEPDLGKFEKEPMVFAVYGRGRAMPPYVGKGITRANLVDCIAFLAGACSCMVKDENPGVDLLMRWDWDATATAMAAQDEASGDGSPSEYGKYRESAQETSGRFAAARSPDNPAEKSPVDTAQAAAPGGTSAEKPALDAAAPIEHAASVTATRPIGGAEGRRGNGSGSLATRQAWTIGIGLALAAIAVVAAGLLLGRRQ